MRNAFVVLVALCIGLAAGFIAPPRLKKHKIGATLEENIVTKGNSINSILDMPSKKESTRRKTTLDNINDKAIYEHGTKKENFVNERSFLFLNQRYKKPNRHQQVLSANCNIFDQSLKDEGADQISSIPSKLSNVFFDESYNHFVNPNKLEKITSAYFGPPNCNLGEKGDKNTPTNVFNNERQNYVELLKEPITRTANNNVKYNDKHGMELNKAHMKTSGGKRKLFNVQKSTPANRQGVGVGGGMVKTFGYTRPYILHRPVFNKELDSIHSNFLNDDYVQRVLSNSGEDKLLNRLLKASYTEHVHNDNHKSICNSQNCKPMSTTPTNKMHVHEANCICGQWLHMKSQVGKERLQRDELNANAAHTTILPMSNELANYEDILTSNSYTSTRSNEFSTTTRKSSTNLPY